MSIKSIVKAVDSTSGDTCEILLYGEISEYWGISAEDFLRELRYAEANFSKIIIRIHCPGGSVFEGWAIYNAIRNCRAHVTTCVDGVAASMGSLILLAGRRIIMNKYSLLMIHNPSACAEGEIEDLEKAIDLLKVVSGQMVEAYVSRTGKTTEEITAMMKAETWLSSDEALAQGFIDEIKDGVADMPEGYPTNFKTMKPKNAASIFDSRIAAIADGYFNPPNMDKKKTCEALGLDPTVSDDVLLAKLKEINAKASELDVVKAKAKAEAEAALNLRITAAVEKAITEGRVLANAKDSFIAIGMKQGADELDKVIAGLPAHTSLKSMIQPLTGAEPVPGIQQPAAWDKTKMLEWVKHDPEGLQALEKSNPAAYAALK
jgi:ATP-dependent Clp endopeptidase proteolytic subunit ClpP